MAMFYDVVMGDALVLVNKGSGLAPIQALSVQDKKDSLGDTAYLDVDLYGSTNLGIRSMTINVNFWDVYKKDDPKLIGVVLDYYQPVKGY